MLAVKIHCALGLNFFPQFTIVCKCPSRNFGNSTPRQFASAQWSLFRLWQLENEGWRRRSKKVESELFHRTFANPFTIQRRRRNGVQLTAQWQLGIANYCRRVRCNFKGLSEDEGGADFYKNLRDSLFNDDLSNESTVISAGSISQDSTFNMTNKLSEGTILNIL